MSIRKYGQKSFKIYRPKHFVDAFWMIIVKGRVECKKGIKKSFQRCEKKHQMKHEREVIRAFNQLLKIT